MKGMSTIKHQLKQLIEQRALLSGNFSLASGSQSSLYFNLPPVSLDPVGLQLISQLFYDQISPLEAVTHVGGPAIGAIPLVVGLVAYSRQQTRPLTGLLVRSQVKQHGLSNKIEGDLPQGAKVVILEDVVSTGRSALECAQVLTKQGAQIVQLSSVIDRQPSPSRRLGGYPYTYLFRANQFRWLQK